MRELSCDSSPEILVASILETVFTFLFKYPVRVYERGDLLLAPEWPPTLVVGAAVVALVVVATTYGRVRAARRDRRVLGTLRAAVLGLVAVCLLRPSLVVSSSVPQRNVLGMLLDDSRSMRVADLDGETRLTAVRRAFADSAELVRRLSERFALRFFRFAADAGPLAGPAALTAAGTRTDLGAALGAAREELAGFPLAGLVVVSDGADNSGSDPTPALGALRGRGVPVHTVGVGRERLPRDLAVERVVLPPSALAGAGVVAEAAIRVRGLHGERTTVTVEADGRIISTEEVRLPPGDVARVRLRLPALAAGTYRVAVRVRPADREMVTENNEFRAVLRVRPGPEKILHVEGEPRPEFAFLRRALATDSGLQLVGLMRSAEGKFLRLGVDDSLELVQGFPTSREQLFRYRGIMLGSIEAAFFTGDQLRMLADFVNRRGGGLLALGGRAALAEGGFAGTSVADILPVSLEREDRPRPSDAVVPAVELRLRPTPAGLAHAALQLEPGEGPSTARWDSLPPVTTVNRLGAVRPGATTLLTGRPTDGGAPVPALAVQRYGRGVAAVFSVQDSWLWQMHARIAPQDETHETFWRQLLRWLVEGVPDRVTVAAAPARVGPGEPVEVRATVVDEAFLDVNDAQVLARATAPSGREVEIPLDWTLGQDGSYAGRFVAEESGVYRLEAEARRRGDTTRSGPGLLLVDDHGADLAPAELGAPLLRRIAAETRGRYYPLADAGRLPDDVVYTESGVTVREVRDLWDMPAVFLLVLALLGGEWAYRRWRGLA
jgi:hypothetical protein